MYFNLLKTHVSGLISAPNIPQFNISPANIRFEFFQSKCSNRRLANGANVNVPKPEPQTAMPVANERFVSK